MGVPRAASLVLAFGVLWPTASGAPTPAPRAPGGVVETCAPEDPRAIALRCETPARPLAAVSVLDALPAAPFRAPSPAPIGEPGTLALRVPAAAVPEPASLALLLAGLTGLALRRRAR